MPEISVIVPVYNAEKSLENCIKSLCSQSFSDIEIILVDDGSKDKSAFICDEYVKRDDRIKVFHNENHGVSATRNFGIENSVGKYIMFCDSDDSVHEDWCLEHYRAIKSHPDSWIVSGEVSHYNDGRVITSLPCAENETLALSRDEYFKVFCSGLSGYSCNHIFSRGKLGNIRYNENISCGEDVLFNNAYLDGCDGIFCIGKGLYNYERGEDSLSTRYNRDFFYVHKPLYESRKKFIKKEDMPEFCRRYFQIFVLGLKATFDSRNHESFSEKLSYNNRILKDGSFKECLEIAELSAENSRYIGLLRSGNYLKVFLYEKLYAIKRTLTK